MWIYANEKWYINMKEAFVAARIHLNCIPSSGSLILQKTFPESTNFFEAPASMSFILNWKHIEETKKLFNYFSHHEKFTSRSIWNTENWFRVGFKRFWFRFPFSFENIFSGRTRVSKRRFYCRPLLGRFRKYLMIVVHEWVKRRKRRRQKHLISYYNVIYIREMAKHRGRKAESERSSGLKKDGLLSRCVWFTCHIFLRQCS